MSVPSPGPPMPPENSTPGPFVARHIALVLLAVLVIGLIVAGLAFL
ncbi:hypothetical protein [Streptomyces chartreusis]